MMMPRLLLIASLPEMVLGIIGNKRAPKFRAWKKTWAFQEGMSHRQAFLLECFLSIFCALVLACCLGLCLEHCRQTRRPKDKRRELQMKIKRLADMHAKSG